MHTQAVVRAKLAGMISRVESSQNWIESVTHQMNHVNPQPKCGEQLPNLRCTDVLRRTIRQAGWRDRLIETVRNFPRTIAHLCSHFHRYITRTGREIAEDATQIFGGRSVTVTGMGKLIENVRPTSLPHILRASTI